MVPRTGSRSRHWTVTHTNPRTPGLWGWNPDLLPVSVGTGSRTPAPCPAHSPSRTGRGVPRNQRGGRSVRPFVYEAPRLSLCLHYPTVNVLSFPGGRDTPGTKGNGSGLRRGDGSTDFVGMETAGTRTHGRVVKDRCLRSAPDPSGSFPRPVPDSRGRQGLSSGRTGVGVSPGGGIPTPRTVQQPPSFPTLVPLPGLPGPLAPTLPGPPLERTILDPPRTFQPRTPPTSKTQAGTTTLGTPTCPSPSCPT